MLREWQPHLLILDMDLNAGQVLQEVGARAGGGARLPVIGLTRRGDLKSKLAAFEAGVDDILTIPFAPEELLARVIALMRRSYSDAVTFTPVIKLGELEIDILNRTVRAGTLRAAPDVARAEPALPAGGQRRPSGHARGDPGRALGYRLRGREQCGRSTDSQSARPTPERLAAAALHRHHPWPRLSVPADVHCTRQGTRRLSGPRYARSSVAAGGAPGAPRRPVARS